MSGMMCELCGMTTTDATVPRCHKGECPGQKPPGILKHLQAPPPAPDAAMLDEVYSAIDAFQDIVGWQQYDSRNALVSDIREKVMAILRRHSPKAEGWRPKMEWRRDSWGKERQALFVGEIYVGSILDGSTPRRKGQWRSWIASDDDGSEIGWHETPDEARKAVEADAYKRLALPTPPVAGE